DKLKYEEFEITSPPERGVRIINTKTEDPKKCVPAFTSLEIKVQTDEYALCMIDTKRKESMEQMTKLMDEGNYLTLNHTLFIPSSATASLEQLENMGYVLEEGRDYGFFIKCKDDNGNENPLHFLVEFCIDDGPDTNAPIITGTSKEQKDFIKFNETETPLTVYLNEPATCKWDFEDKEYNLMGYNFGSCSSPESLTYWCSGNLTGLKNDQENKFYIRCKDKPWWTEKDYEEKNVKQFANEESYPFALKGTRSLYIDKITINREESGAKIKDSANPTKVTIEVKTSAGAEEGVSTCSYLTSRESWSEFSNGGTFEPSYKNFESFWLSAGTYKREIKCSDAAGNSDTAEINFTIETDREAPIIVRAFREGTSYLKVITDEEAECVYSLNNCNYEFEDGIEMMTNDNLEHFEDWNTNLEYSIKCKDEYGNQPEPNQCNMVVRASDF
ncbi:MAG: hypothetical protein KJ566_00070, partial [Nanoarchaeota archaeon]|nr:hypothetical protein [Nanoarchaeota archaeon]